MATRKVAAPRAGRKAAGHAAVSTAVTKPAKAAPAKPPGRFETMATVSLPALLEGTPGDDKRFRQMLYDLSTAAIHLEAARAYLANQVELTPPQYNMLMVIAQHEGDRGLSVSQVGAYLHVSNTFITSEVIKLVQSGLVKKLPNPEDARGVLLRLTREGQTRIQKLQPALHFVNDQLFAQLSASDFKTLSRIVGQLIPEFERTVAMLDALGSKDGRVAVQRGRPKRPSSSEA